jgi:hypothetical protein
MVGMARGDRERDARIVGSARARARAAFTQFAESAELAPLVYDSLTDGTSDADHFWLVFQHRGAQVQLSVRAVDRAWGLRARIDPPIGTRAELQMDGSEIALIETGADGDFTFRGITPGVMRLVIAGSARNALLHTDWFVLGPGPR